MLPVDDISGKDAAIREEEVAEDEGGGGGGAKVSIASYRNTLSCLLLKEGRGRETSTAKLKCYISFYFRQNFLHIVNVVDRITAKRLAQKTPFT